MNNLKNPKLNLFVVILTYISDLSQIDAARPEHLAFLEEYYKSGMFIASGVRVPRTGGVIIAKGFSQIELENILANDPFAIKSLARYEVIEFSPTKWCDTLDSILQAQS